MLTLTRRVNEAILIGNIRIVVTEIRGKQVRLSIAAPKDVKIQREELLKDDKTKREKTIEKDSKPFSKNPAGDVKD